MIFVGFSFRRTRRTLFSTRGRGNISISDDLVRKGLFSQWLEESNAIPQAYLQAAAQVEGAWIRSQLTDLGKETAHGAQRLRAILAEIPVGDYNAR